MPRFEIRIPGLDSGDPSLKLRVAAADWLEALKTGLAKLGRAHVKSDSIVCEILDDGTISVDDQASGHRFHIVELGAGSAPAGPPAKADRPEPRRATAQTERVGVGLRPPSFRSPPQRPRVPTVADDTPEPTPKEKLVHELSRAHSLEEKAALYFLLDTAIERIPVEAGSILVMSSIQNELRFAAARGPRAEELLRMDPRIPAGTGFAGFCVEMGTTLALSEAQKHPRLYRRISKKLGYETRSVACAPMAEGGRVVGCVQLINRLGNPNFSDGEVGVLKVVAREAAKVVART